MNAIELLTDLQRQGFILIPLPEGKLEVKPAAKLNDDIRRHIRQYKVEVLTLLARPYLNDRGELIIPLTAAPQYRWWAGGQSIRDTLRELGAPPEVLGRYVEVDLTKSQ